MKVLLVCERSAGHIFPALCFAKKLSKESNSKVYFFATSRLLKTYVIKEGFKVLGVSFPFRNLIIEGVWRFFEAIYLILKIRPQKVIGFGGRDTFFLVLFSCIFCRDTAIYDPNISLGKANKVLSFFVSKIFRGFQEPQADKKSKIIGIPLRQNIKKIDRQKARRILNFDDKPVIFCFGGSQGSSFLNHMFLRAVQHLGKDFQIIHLTGKQEYREMLMLYKKIKNNKFIEDFYYDMENLYSAADIVVSRAGASTLAEISFYGLPSILIPHPKAGAHQKENAIYFQNKDASSVFIQDNFSIEDFSNLLTKFIKDISLIKNMGESSSKIKLGVAFEDFCNNSYF